MLLFDSDLLCVDGLIDADDLGGDRGMRKLITHRKKKLLCTTKVHWTLKLPEQPDTGQNIPAVPGTQASTWRAASDPLWQH